MGKILFLLTLWVSVTLNLNAQNLITEKGYIYSPNGFVCYDGDIYTADMKNLVRSCYPSIREREKDHFGNIVKIPSGAEVIPSHLIYHTDGKLINSGNNTSYCVLIPSSVKYIAVDAFLTPYIKFFSEETNVASVRQIQTKDDNITEFSRYNLQGQKLDSPERGINIVQMSNHTSHKELVK